jgi:putative transposase
VSQEGHRLPDVRELPPGTLISWVLRRPLEPKQYLAIRYTERLADAGVVNSVGSKGDSYDNAMAEAFNSLFKAELIRNKGPWKGIDDVEIAVAEYIDWFNHRRLHGEIGMVPPVEYEQQYYSENPVMKSTKTTELSLH